MRGPRAIAAELKVPEDWEVSQIYRAVQKMREYPRPGVPSPAVCFSVLDTQTFREDLNVLTSAMFAGKLDRALDPRRWPGLLRALWRQLGKGQSLRDHYEAMIEAVWNWAADWVDDVVFEEALR